MFEEAQGEQRTPAAGHYLDVPRAVLLSFLLIAVAIGSHVNHSSVVLTRSGFRRTAAAGVLDGVVVSLLVILHRRAKAGRTISELQRWIRGSLLAILWPAALVLTALFLAAVLGISPPVNDRCVVIHTEFGPTQQCTSVVQKPLQKFSGPVIHFPLLLVLYTIAALMALTGSIAAAWWVRHRSRRPSAGAHDAGLAPALFADLTEELLEDARRALLDEDDPRIAIISSYAAMERHLAAVGTSREQAETPDEFLRHIVTMHPGAAWSAGNLTRLFYEARFSSHTVGPDDKYKAALALSDLSAAIDPTSVPGS